MFSHRVHWLKAMLAGALALPTLGIAGCGEPPAAAKQLVEEASRALKGEKPKLEFPETNDASATIKAKFEDGTELTWEVAKEGADWALDTCDATDAAGFTDNCVPTDPPPVATSAEFADCVIGLADSPKLWSLCDPLVAPDTEAEAKASWNACRARGRPPIACAALL